MLKWSNFYKIIRHHMEKQPHIIICRNCGKNLQYNLFYVDEDLDISIEVNPCDCIKDEDEKEKD